MKINKIPKAMSLNSFRNTHYHVVNNLKQEYKHFVRLSMQESSEKIRPLKTPIKTVFYFANWRNRDLDNEAICIKNFHDSLTELGMIPDDSRKYLKAYSVEELDVKGDYYNVEIIEDIQLKIKNLTN